MDKLQLPLVEEFRPSSTAFCLTKWKMDQYKVTFLPTLVQTAVLHSCRVILLIEHSGDWPSSAVNMEEGIAAASSG